MSKWDVLQVGFAAMKILGECRDSVTFRTYIMRALKTFMFVQNYTIIIISAFHANMNDFMVTMEAATSLFHFWLKYTWFFYNQPNFVKLCQDMSRYWDCNRFSDKALLYQLESIASFTSDRTYAIYVKIEIGNPSTRCSVMVSQFYVLIVSSWVNICYDFIIIELCCQTAVRLKLLRVEMRKIGADLPKRKFIEVVKHHQLVMRVLLGIESQYSLIFFMQFVIVITSICSELFFMAKGILVNSLMYCAILLALYVTYYIASEELGSKISELCNGIHSSKWFECLSNLSKDIPLVIMATQRQIYFTIGGLTHLNMEALITVLRSVFSFHAFVKQLVFNE